MTRTWTEKTVSFHGKYYRVDNAIVEPKPLQKPHPPLLFGGWSQRIVRLAGEKGDGWTPIGPRSGEAVKTPDDYKRFVRLIAEGLSKSGRKRDEFDFGCRFGPFDNPRDYVREIEDFRTAGLNCYQLGVNVKKHSENVLRIFGDSVIATF